MTVPFDKLAELEGLLNPGIGEALAGLAGAVPEDLAVVEVGSFKGKSTAYLAAGAKDGAGAHVWAVDPWDLPGNVYGKHGYNAPVVRETFERQLRSLRLWARVTAVRSFSADAAAAWDGPPIGLLFIDGDHTERAVRADLAAWSPHLAPSHVVAFDDYDTKRNPGVKAVVDGLTSGYTVTVAADHLAVCTSR